MQREVLYAFMQRRDVYDKLSKYIDDDDFEGVPSIIYRGIGEYYDNDLSAQSVTAEVLTHKLASKYERFKEDIEEVLGCEAASAKLSIPNIEETFVEGKKAVVGNKLSSALMRHNSKEAVDLMEQYRRYDSILEDDSDNITEFTGSKEMLVNIVAKREEPEFKFSPTSLNDALGGGADRKDHVLIYARPNAGKTLVTINLVAKWLAAGKKVLYLGNEDSVDKMLIRFVCRFNNKPKVDIYDDIEKYTDIALERGLKNLVFKELTPGTLREVASEIEKHQPDVTVIDQIRNISVGGDGMTAKLEAAAMAVRNMGKKYNCLMVSITQAGKEARNKRVLEMEDVDSSKTGIQAALDAMIGVGNDEGLERQNRRYISVRKNKLGGSNKQFPIRINPLTSRAMDISKE